MSSKDVQRAVNTVLGTQGEPGWCLSALSVSSAAESSWDQAPLSPPWLGKSGFVCSPSQLSQLPGSAGLSGSGGTE